MPESATSLCTGPSKSDELEAVRADIRTVLDRIDAQGLPTEIVCSPVQEDRPKGRVVQKPIFKKLSPAEAARFWQFFEYGMLQSVPPGVAVSAEFMLHALLAVLRGDMQCWMSFVPPHEGGSEGKVLGVVVTQVREEEISGTRQLFIYSLYGYGGAPTYQWKSGMAALMKYCQELGIGRIVAHTEAQNVLRIADVLRCKSKTVMLEWEVPSEVPNHDVS